MTYSPGFRRWYNMVRRCHSSKERRGREPAAHGNAQSRRGNPAAFSLRLMLLKTAANSVADTRTMRDTAPVSDWRQNMPWWVVAGAVGIVAIATALWWWLPKRQVNLLRQEIPDAKARADVEDNFRKTIGQLLGGAAVLIGAGFAYYHTQLTQQASHDQIISQQVSKGFELLGQQGSDKLVVRLGGIYALEGVMNTSEP